jgi:hypothetical protein
MVARTAAISSGVRASTTRSLHRSAAISIGAFFTGSPYASGGGVAAATSGRNLRTYMPDRSVAVVGSDGLMTTQWYLFFRYVVDKILGNTESITLLDLESAQNYAQWQNIQTTTALAATDQQVRQNALVLQAQVQVSQTAALPGSTNIPTVQLYKQDRDIVGDTGGGSGE